eukprot:366406-Chlamydomonas_euryale.AAC.20
MLSSSPWQQPSIAICMQQRIMCQTMQGHCMHEHAMQTRHQDCHHSRPRQELESFTAHRQLALGLRHHAAGRPAAAGGRAPR